MGLIKAALSSASGVLSSQWKEYFYCDAMDDDVLVVKAKKKVSRGSSNTANDNIISNGSVIAVADGQCMIIVENGKVVDLCAVAGEYTFDTSAEPSIFDGGNLSDNIKEVFANFKNRVGFGGQAAQDQRVYYFNLKEIMGNKFGTPNAVPFRVVDERAGIDIDISVRCFGEYSYRITDPILFYANVCGNVASMYTRDEIDSQLKSELLNSLQPAFAVISEAGVRYSAVPAHTKELCAALKNELSAEWSETRGIEIQKVAVSSIKASEEDEKRIKDMQQEAAYMDPTRGAARIINAQAAAMQAAANNANGAAMGFMNMNMAAQAGGINANDLYSMGQAQAQQAAAQTATANGWTCPKCGATATGKFCPECGTAKPIPATSWTCPKCGTVATGKFCPECGTARPNAEWTCPSCGKTVTGKFCPECGTKKPE